MNALKMPYLRQVWACVGILGWLAHVAAGADEATLVTDPTSPELRALARPLVVDESKYGCGPLRRPGKTYYLSLDGSDQADGLSWDTAWRHVHHAFRKVRAGDTLIIGEGTYIEPPLAPERRIHRETDLLPGIEIARRHALPVETAALQIAEVADVVRRRVAARQLDHASGSATSTKRRESW